MNASKSLALAFVAGFALSLPVSSCGPTSGACNADNCANGCCDAQDKCQTADVFHCGRAGSTCSPCGATQACIVGVCTGGTGAGPGGGGSGFTGGGAGSTGGGSATTGGGSATTGGGSATTGGGSATTGGGSGACAADSTLVLSGSEAHVSGTTTDKGSNTTFACTSTNAGTDLIYGFVVTTSGTEVTATVNFDTDVYGGLALVSLGSCTTSSTDCQEPTNSSSTLNTTLAAGTWGVVVKTYDDGTTANPGAFSLDVYLTAPVTGGGSGTTGGGVGTTGGGVGTTGGGVGTTGGGVGSTGGGVGSTGGGTGTTGGGTGTTGGGVGSTGGGTGTTGGGTGGGVPSGWTCNPAYYAGGPTDGCDCGCGAFDPDCTLQTGTTQCQYCSQANTNYDGSCANDGTANGCNTALLSTTNNGLCN